MALNRPSSLARRAISTALAAWLACSAAGSSAQRSNEPLQPRGDARSPDILLGMSTALTGPAAELGTEMRDGVNAALAELERNGGLRGRAVRLIARDDGYEPERTGQNIRALVEEERVLAIVGNVGTPTAVAALPITNANETPFYGAFSGAGLLRKSPPDHWVVNYRASYAEETKAMLDALIAQAGLSIDEIAFFTQRDAYGDAAFNGCVDALRPHGLRDASALLHTRYERNTIAVEKALGEIMLSDPRKRAVVMVGTYRPCAEFIRQARELELDALFLNVSFVGSLALVTELGALAEGVIVTQVVPHPASDLPLTAEFRGALRALDPQRQPTFAALEGYVSTRILCRALGTLDGVPDRAAVIRALESLGTFDIGLGEPLTLTSTEHQACHRVWPTIVRAGRVVPFDWTELKKRS